MKPQNLAMGAMAGVLLAAPMIAIMYVADKWIDLSFPPFDVFDWIARVLPGSVITFGIDLMIGRTEAHRRQRRRHRQDR